MNAVIGKMSCYHLIQHFLHFTNGLTEPKINKLPRCLERGGWRVDVCTEGLWILDTHIPFLLKFHSGFVFFFLGVRKKKCEKLLLDLSRLSIFCSYEATRSAGDRVSETGDFY